MTALGVFLVGIAHIVLLNLLVLLNVGTVYLFLLKKVVTMGIF